MIPAPVNAGVPRLRNAGRARRFRALRLFAVACLASSGALSKVAASEGESFPDRIVFRDTALERRSDYTYTYRFFFDLYSVALYTAPGATAKDVLDRREPFRLQFHYLREIKKKIILRSADKMLEKNLTPDSREMIGDRVAKLNQAYRTVREGDRSALTYLPGEGTFLSINGTEKARIEGADFAHRYFRIWLGRNPISDDLKNALLEPL